VVFDRREEEKYMTPPNVATETERSSHHRIGVIAGDGIGPEVVREGLKVLEAVAPLEGFTYELVSYPWSCAYFVETGQVMPESMLDEYRQLDAILFGAVGDPRVKGGTVERSIIFTLRFGLDLFVNLRPVVLLDSRLCPLKEKTPSDVDMVVVRENTEDAYTAIGGQLRRGSANEVSIAEMIFTRMGVERVIRYGFELARAGGRRKNLTVVDKSNAISAMDIWRRVLAEVGKEYPDVTTNSIYVDAACLYMVERPEMFDVIVTSNLFGDILTDLGAAIQGGMGAAASGNINPGHTSMFEPIHGSAPDIAGKEIASPVATILAVAMLLDHLGEQAAAGRVNRAVRDAVVSGRIPRLDAGSGLSTATQGDIVASSLT
jgi:3-isopropylmalate dehydrogenase